MYTGYGWLLKCSKLIMRSFGAFQFFWFSTILYPAHPMAKGNKIWTLGGKYLMCTGTFDILVFNVIMRSFGAFPIFENLVSRKSLASEQNRSIFWSWGQSWCIQGTFDRYMFKVNVGSFGSFRSLSGLHSDPRHIATLLSVKWSTRVSRALSVSLAEVSCDAHVRVYLSVCVSVNKISQKVFPQWTYFWWEPSLRKISPRGKVGCRGVRHLAQW